VFIELLLCSAEIHLKTFSEKWDHRKWKTCVLIVYGNLINTVNGRRNTKFVHRDRLRTREENVTDIVQQTKPTEKNSSWEAKLVKKLPSFMKHEGSLPHSQQSVIGNYPEPDLSRSSPIPDYLLLTYVNIIFVPSTLTPSKWFLFPNAPIKTSWKYLLPLRATCRAHLLLDLTTRDGVIQKRTKQYIQYKQ
jgi:hypothetical protein